MNRIQLVVATLLAASALGFTLHMLGQHEVELPASPRPAAAAFERDSTHLPSIAHEETPPPMF
jgi:hypothetical protein